MNNTQAPEKRVLKRITSALEVFSIFFTIQGEGPFCGHPAVFIRLAGCNLQCPKCDTDYTSKRSTMKIEDIAAAVFKLNEVEGDVVTRLVVITGGEPFRQAIGPLINLLVKHDFLVQVETNGTFAPPADVTWNHDTSLLSGAFIVCSPKTGRIHPATAQSVCALKYVMASYDVSPDDGLPLHALDHTAAPFLARLDDIDYYLPIYLQPMDEQDEVLNKAHLKACVKSCMRYGYILQLQVHKLIGME